MKIVSRFFVIFLSSTLFSYVMHAMKEEVVKDLVSRFGDKPYTYRYEKELGALLLDAEEPLWKKKPQELAKFLNQQDFINNNNYNKKNLLVHTGVAAAAAYLIQDDYDAIRNKNVLKKKSSNLRNGFGIFLLAAVGSCAAMVHQLLYGNTRGKLLAGGGFVGASALSCLFYSWKNRNNNSIKNCENQLSGYVKETARGDVEIDTSCVAQLARSYAIEWDGEQIKSVRSSSDIFRQLYHDFGNAKQRDPNWPVIELKKIKDDEGMHQKREVLHTLIGSFAMNLEKQEIDEQDSDEIDYKILMPRIQAKHISDILVKEFTKNITQESAASLAASMQYFLDDLSIGCILWNFHERILFASIVRALAQSFKLLKSRWGETSWPDERAKPLLLVARECFQMIDEDNLRNFYSTNFKILDQYVLAEDFFSFLSSNKDDILSNINIKSYVDLFDFLLPVVKSQWLTADVEKIEYAHNEIKDFFYKNCSYITLNLPHDFTFKMKKETVQEEKKEEHENLLIREIGACSWGTVFYVSENEKEIEINEEFLTSGSEKFKNLSLLEKQMCFIVWSMVEEENKETRKMLARREEIENMESNTTNQIDDWEND